MTKRNRRVQIRLSDEELATAETRAAENDLTLSDLFRNSTLNRRLPRRVTKIAGQTYWELIKIEAKLSQLIQMIDIAQAQEASIVVDSHLLKDVRDLVMQVRCELADLD
jgi:hypothetical protein